MNCLLCDRVISAAYLAKYAAGVEERATVTVGGSTDSTVIVSVKKMANIKISGARLAAEKDAATSEHFRLVALSECLWTILELPYVHTSYDSIHVCTLPLEHRGGIIKTQSSQFRNSDATVTAFITSRQNSDLSVYYKFTENQKIVLNSVFSIDKVSLFGVRPPELTWIVSIETYFTFFLQFKVRCHPTQSVPFTQHWYNAVGQKVMLRSCAVESFITLCYDCRSSAICAR